MFQAIGKYKLQACHFATECLCEGLRAAVRPEVLAAEVFHALGGFGGLPQRRHESVATCDNCDRLCLEPLLGLLRPARAALISAVVLA